MLRRSIACMLAGLLITGPIVVIGWAWDYPEWQPHRIVVVILAFVCIAGIMLLYDELHDPRPNRDPQRLPLVQKRKPSRQRRRLTP